VQLLLLLDFHKLVSILKVFGHQWDSYLIVWSLIMNLKILEFFKDHSLYFWWYSCLWPIFLCWTSWWLLLTLYISLCLKLENFKLKNTDFTFITTRNKDLIAPLMILITWLFILLLLTFSQFCWCVSFHLKILGKKCQLELKLLYFGSIIWL